MMMKMLLLMLMMITLYFIVSRMVKVEDCCYAATFPSVFDGL